MAKGNTKQRAKKKQQKQQQRKKKLARRDGKALPVGFGAREKPADLLKGWDPTKHGVVGLAQRRKLPFVEAAHYAASAQRGGHPGAGSIWTPSRVAALSDEELFAKLASLGIATDRAAFLALTEGETSALTKAGEPWARSLPAAATPADQDFVRLAAWDLWRRLRPETPSIEALLVRHLEGWDADGRGRPDEAIDLWLEFGQMLWKAFPKARSMEAIDLALNGPTKKGGFFFDAFAEVLAGLATEEAVHHGHDHGDDHDHGHAHDPEAAFARARKVAAYLDEIVTRLPDSKLEHLELLQATRASVFDAIQDYDAASAILEGLIERSPHRGIGYVMLAESLLDKEDLTPADIDKAREILEKGRHAEDAQKWGIDTRLDGLRDLLADTGAPDDEDI
ncbi:MAG: hypothetical protein U0441_14600 [Polyangiaceae bacterium]